MKLKHKLLVAGFCLLFAALLTTAFTVAAARLGRYTTVDIYIGALWFFTISLILSSPLLLPRVRKRFNP